MKGTIKKKQTDVYEITYQAKDTNGKHIWKRILMKGTYEQAMDRLKKIAGSVANG